MQNLNRLPAVAASSPSTAEPLKPGHFFVSPQRREALKDLWFGISSGAACLLTAGHGMGKTQLCRELLLRLPVAVRSIYLTAPSNNENQRNQDQDDADPIDEEIGHRFLQAVRRNMHTRRRASYNDALTRNGASDSPPVWAVIVDEAHRLNATTLKRLELWRRHELNQGYAVALLLVGQPELAATLKQPECAALDSQTQIRCSLDAFDPQQTLAYIDHWVKTHRVPRVPFSDPAHRIVHYSTSGVPRLINQVCARALEAVRQRGGLAVSALIAARAAWAITGD